MDGGGETTVLKAVALAEGLAPFATKDRLHFSAGGRSGRRVGARKFRSR